MLWLLLLIVLVVVVLVWVSRQRPKAFEDSIAIRSPILGGEPELRDVLVYYETDAESKNIKQTFAKLKGVKPLYNVTKPSDYSNVPVVWVGSASSRASDFQRTNPGVCGAIILWHPTTKDNKLGPDSAAYTFVVLDTSKKGQDNEWAECSQHRYYVPKGPGYSHLADILSMIR